MPEQARALGHSIELWYRDKYGLTHDDPRFNATYAEMLVEFYAEQVRLGLCYCKHCKTWFKGRFCTNCGKPNEWRAKPRTCLNPDCKHEQASGRYCSECGLELPMTDDELDTGFDYGVVDAPIVIEDDRITSWRRQAEAGEADG